MRSIDMFGIALRGNKVPTVNTWYFIEIFVRLESWGDWSDSVLIRLLSGLPRFGVGGAIIFLSLEGRGHGESTSGGCDGVAGEVELYIEEAELTSLKTLVFSGNGGN